MWEYKGIHASRSIMYFLNQKTVHKTIDIRGDIKQEVEFFLIPSNDDKFPIACFRMTPHPSATVNCFNGIQYITSTHHVDTRVFLTSRCLFYY